MSRFPLPCAICGATPAAAFSVNGIALVDCPQCGHRQADLAVDAEHVEQTYGDDYFTGGGAGYQDYAGYGPMLIARGKRYGSILAKHRAPGAVLDIGAAAGFLAEGMGQAGWTPIGVEPNEAMAAAGRARQVDVRSGPAETVLDQFEPSSFDAVSMIQVIAHLGKPLDTLHTANKLLRPGGLLLIETWDRSSKLARVFGKKWHEYSPPSVVHWFTRTELDAVAERAGFARVASGLYPKKITASHAHQLLAHRMGESNPMVKVASRVPSGLSVPYPGDDLFWTLYRRE